MKYQRTTLSLQFRHPERDLTAICDELGLAPKFTWKAGDQRRTPRGNLLEGIRPSSYCSIDLGPTRRVSLARQIETTLGLLQPHRRMLRRFSSSGGGISLFISVYGLAQFPLILLMIKTLRAQPRKHRSDPAPDRRPQTGRW